MRCTKQNVARLFLLLACVLPVILMIDQSRQLAALRIEHPEYRCGMPDLAAWMVSTAVGALFSLLALGLYLLHYFKLPKPRSDKAAWESVSPVAVFILISFICLIIPSWV